MNPDLDFVPADCDYTDYPIDIVIDNSIEGVIRFLTIAYSAKDRPAYVDLDYVIKQLQGLNDGTGYFFRLEDN